MAELVPWEVSLEDGLLNAYLHGQLTVEGGLNVPLSQKVLFGDGNTQIYQPSANHLYFVTNGSTKLILDLNGSFYIPGGAALRYNVPTAILPSLVPLQTDTNTGIGTAGGDQLSLIAGGVEGIRVFETATHILNYFKGINIFDSIDILTGAGACSIYTSSTHIVTTAADALTLADGYNGQIKFIIMKTHVGNGTLTPAHFANGSTITFNSVGDSCQLLYSNNTWHYMGGHGCVIA